MSRGRNEDVTGRLRPGAVLRFLAVFALLAVLLTAQVRLYEAKEENRRLSEELARQQEILTELRQAAARQPGLYKKAMDMGLRPPEPEEIRILHIRQQ